MSNGTTSQESERQRLRITLVRSPIGYAEKQKRIIQSLGLRKMNQTVEHNDSDMIRGMITKVGHMLKVEPLPPGTAPTYRSETGTDRFKARMAKKQAEREALAALFEAVEADEAGEEKA